MAGKVGTKASQQSLLSDLADELMRIGRRRHVNVDGTQLDMSAFKLLWILSDDRPRTLRELADELQLDQSTVNRQVNAAIKHGLVERYAVAESQSRLLRPTDAGRSAYLHDAALRARLFDAVLDELGTDRARALVAELRELNDGLDRAHSRLRPEPPAP
jgi:DNA-binding MarR family transcriptional regulator